MTCSSKAFASRKKKAIASEYLAKVGRAKAMLGIGLCRTVLAFKSSILDLGLPKRSSWAGRRRSRANLGAGKCSLFSSFSKKGKPGLCSFITDIATSFLYSSNHSCRIRFEAYHTASNSNFLFRSFETFAQIVLLLIYKAKLGFLWQLLTISYCMICTYVCSGVLLHVFLYSFDKFQHEYQIRNSIVY